MTPAWRPGLRYLPRNAGVGQLAFNRRPLPPFLLGQEDQTPEPWARYFVPVAHWFDGSPAPLYSET